VTHKDDSEPVDAHLFDPWTRDYAHLGLRMERLAPGTVDAWIGPLEWRASVDAEPAPTPGALRAGADALLELLPSMGYPPPRAAYLQRQVTALQAQSRTLAGEPIGLVEQARLYFDIAVRRVPEEIFAAAHATLDQLLPGSGPLVDRRAAWRRRYQAGPERVLPLIDRIAAEARRRTTARLPLPAAERIEVRLTQDQPWGAYNWYLGQARSLIEINTDRPLQVDGLVDYLAHEGYPGHHTEHALREAWQYRGQGQGEYAIQLINTPESLISEAIATCATELIFPDDEDLAWLAQEILPTLDMPVDVAAAGRIRQAGEALAGVSGNAAFLLHEDGRPADEVVAYLERWAVRTPEEARHHLRFLVSPLWRVYTFTYSSGHDLLAPLLRGPDRWDVFRRVLTTPVYPAALAAEGAEGPGA
jgi:hypothetical protein